MQYVTCQLWTYDFTVACLDFCWICKRIQYNSIQIRKTGESKCGQPPVNVPSYGMSSIHRRRIETEGKAKVVASVWGAEFVQFLAALAVLPRSIEKKRLNSAGLFGKNSWIQPFLSAVLMTLRSQCSFLSWPCFQRNTKSITKCMGELKKSS